jgi:long-chain acyl-CoA synthetase
MERTWLSHYEQGVPHDLELDPRTVVQFLDTSASRWPGRPAVTLKGKTLSYRVLKDHVDRLATALSRLGVERDSKVALWLPNLPQSVIGFFAVLRLGAQVVNTNPLYVEREIEHQFRDGEVTHVITCDFLWMGRLRGIMSRLPRIQHVVVTSIPDYLPFPLRLLAPFKLRKAGQLVDVPPDPRVSLFRDLVSRTPPTPPAVEYGLDHPAVLQYTGGTTGVSKAAVLTHRNLTANAQQCLAWFPALDHGGEVFLACLPYFHVFGMTVAMTWPVSCGAHIVLMPNPRDVAEMVNNIVKYRVSIFPAVPAMYIAVNNYPGVDRKDLRSVKACFSGSAPLPLEALRRFEELTGGTITEGFGMTETSPVTHINPMKAVRKPGTIGMPVSSTWVKVVDPETGECLPVGEEGEMCIKGPQVMTGYWKQEEETRRVLRDGWMHTGDLARVDPDGYFTIVGRKKDMIISAGYKIYPDEVDQALHTHPAVLEAATIGVPDARTGESVKSYVVLKPGQVALPEEIVAHCRTLLAAYKVPRRVEVVASLPKSPMMKILRRSLRDGEQAAPPPV